jgi:hypothetical protein
MILDSYGNKERKPVKANHDIFGVSTDEFLQKKTADFLGTIGARLAYIEVKAAESDEDVDLGEAELD